MFKSATCFENALLLLISPMYHTPCRMYNENHGKTLDWRIDCTGAMMDTCIDVFTQDCRLYDPLTSMKMVVWVSMAIHPRYVFVAVCCCLNIAISVATCDFDNKITNGFRLESFTFGYFPNWTIYGCAAQCVMHVVCASFNFDLTLKACYLNYKSAVENADGLQSHEHFLYSDISVWSKVSK